MSEYTPANIVYGQVGCAEPESEVKRYLKVSEGHHIVVLPTPLKIFDFLFSPDRTLLDRLQNEDSYETKKWCSLEDSDFFGTSH